VKGTTEFQQGSSLPNEQDSFAFAIIRGFASGTICSDKALLTAHKKRSDRK
jgi:hypothetical protein